MILPALWLLFGSTGQAGVQPAAPPATVQHLSSRQGLSHRWVFHISQDSRGFLWISTYGGLNRYDGNEFKVYRPSAGGRLPQEADRTQWPEETGDGRFIVGTEGGILFFAPYAETFALLHPPANALFALPAR